MDNMLPTPYQQFIHKSRYARWLDSEQRRENWDETVYRYTNFMRSHVKSKHDFDISDNDLFDIEQVNYRPRDYAVYARYDDCRTGSGA